MKPTIYQNLGAAAGSADDDGLLPVSERTQRRDNNRTQEQLEICECARRLDCVAQRYKRFEKEINRLADFIRWQLRSSEAKQAPIVEAFCDSLLLRWTNCARRRGSID